MNFQVYKSSERKSEEKEGFYMHKKSLTRFIQLVRNGSCVYILVVYTLTMLTRVLLFETLCNTDEFASQWFCIVTMHA